MNELSHWHEAVLNVYFNGCGFPEKVALLSSSGDRERDIACIAYCECMTIPSTQRHFWKTIKVGADAVLYPTAPPTTDHSGKRITNFYGTIKET